MFKIELKRAFTRTTFKISLLVGICICIINIANLNIRYLNPMEYKVFAQSPFDLWIIFDHSVTASLYIFLLPILSSLAFSDTYLEDLKSGFLKGIYTRKNKRNYLVSKYFANFIVGGTVFVIPLVLNIIVLILTIPSFYPHPILGQAKITSLGLFPELYYSHPIIYILVIMLMEFLFAGAFASIGLSLGIFIKNQFVTLVSPFIIFVVIEIICEFIGDLRYSPFVFLYTPISPSLGIIGGEFLLIFIISFSIFYIGGIKSETF